MGSGDRALCLWLSNRGQHQGWLQISNYPLTKTSCDTLWKSAGLRNAPLDFFGERVQGYLQNVCRPRTYFCSEPYCQND
jgi:hypothetical protein